jgi:hypothetical protein
MEKTAVLLNCRNDGYKEDDRFVSCMNSMIETFDEIWYCDWNSPSDKGSLLYQNLDRIPQIGKIRHFIIDPETTKLLTGSNPKIGDFSYIIPQNILLRRCTADWIVSSAIDIIAPNKKYFDDFLSKINKNTFYTAARRDIEYSGLEEMGFENWREFRDKMDVEVSAIYYPAKITPNDNYSLINCCGDFQLAHRDVWHNIKGFEEQMVYACYQDTNVQKKAVLNGYNLEAYLGLPLYHLSHKGMGNDGSSPSKQYYNDFWDWVEFFNETQNDDNWGLGDTEIEFEII